jgi:hypothetical protein
MSNKLTDLNQHLFTALERLNRQDISNPEAVACEIKRAGAVANLAGQIIDVGRLALEATKIRDQVGQDAAMPDVLGLNESRPRAITGHTAGDRGCRLP